MSTSNHIEGGRGLLYCESQSDEESFKSKQKEYFADILGRKWDCETPGHTVCVPTVDGQHHQLSEEDLRTWVVALCLGDATTAQPPNSVMGYRLNGAGDSTDTLPAAVKTAPSRSHSFRSSTLVSSASLRLSLNSSMSSWASSKKPGLGYYSGKAIKWIGGKSFDVLEEVIMMRQAYQYRSWLSRWDKLGDKIISMKERRKIFRIIDDALEMSRPCYSSGVNDFAADIGYKLNESLGNAGKGENDTLMIHIQLCLSPLLLAQWSAFDPASDDLIWELRKSLMRFPLALQDQDTISAVIGVLSRELAYSSYIFQHRWLGVNLVYIVEETLKVRALTALELDAIHEIVVRRFKEGSNEHPKFCRPWEVALFAACARRDSGSRDVVLGPHGLQSLTSALESLLSKAVFDDDSEWDCLYDIVWALAKLSPYGWVASTMEPKTIRLLVNILRRIVPERWHLIAIHAIIILQDIAPDRLRMMDTLAQEDAGFAISGFLSTTLPLRANRLDQSLRIRAESAAKYVLLEMEDMPGCLIDS